jgi:aromatase
MGLRTTDTVAGAELYRAQHSTVIRADAARAYDLIADVTRWPLLFAPCVHAEVLRAGPEDERIRLWARTGTEVRSWTSRRRHDRAALRVAFRQEDSSPPLASMGGAWGFASAADGTRIVLDHDWTTVDSDPGAEQWIADALDRNSEAEIASVRSWAERAQDPAELIFSFTDELDIAGPVAEVYAFLYRADLWPDRLPHVARLELTTAPASAGTAGAEVQTMEMDTRAGDGSAHTTRSIRLCFEDQRIVYKQTTAPRPLLAHSGEWALTATPVGTRVTARHSVALDPAAVEGYFGVGTSLAAARTKVRQALGGNSRRTLEQARSRVEQSQVEQPQRGRA